MKKSVSLPVSSQFVGRMCMYPVCINPKIRPVLRKALNLLAISLCTTKNKIGTSCPRTTFASDQRDSMSAVVCMYNTTLAHHHHHHQCIQERTCWVRIQQSIRVCRICWFIDLWRTRHPQPSCEHRNNYLAILESREISLHLTWCICCKNVMPLFHALLVTLLQLASYCCTFEKRPQQIVTWHTRLEGSGAYI